MGKYDAQINEIQKYLQAAQNILVALPANLQFDQLASGLSLSLALEQAGKNVAVVTDGIVKVGHTNLFGVGQVQNGLPQLSGGNLTIVLGGVVDPNTKLPPTLQELKYFPEGSDLHLVFYPLPGQRFEPTHITPAYDQVGYDLIFSLGALSLNDLGKVYASNQQLFASSKIINLDNQASNSQFGLFNLVDQLSPSLSEIVYQLIVGGRLPVNADIFSNILTGIYAATSNLQAANVSADTFEIVAQAIKAGGHRPSPGLTSTVVPLPSGMGPASSAQPALYQAATGSASVFNSLFNQSAPVQPVQTVAQSSPEEVPALEQATSSEPEEDWLTPKIYRGTSLG